MDKMVELKIEAFFAKYPRRLADKNQIIIHADEEPAGIFHLLRGQVRQYDITDAGKEVVVNVFKPPAFFPMLWAINNTPNIYFYETTTPVEMRLAPAEDVVMFIRNNNDVMYDLLSRLYSGVDGVQRRMAHLMGGSSKSRILFELILECKRFGVKQSDGSYILNMNEKEIAERSGLARETVNRELAKLKKDNLVSVSHNNFVIASLGSLEDALGPRV